MKLSYPARGTWIEIAQLRQQAPVGQVVPRTGYVDRNMTTIFCRATVSSRTPHGVRG